MKRMGFTLIELMIVLLIIALLTAISFSSLRTLTRNIEIKTKMNNAIEGVLVILNNSRLKSIKNQSYITIHFSDDLLEARSGGSKSSYTMPTRMTLESTPSVSFSTEPTKGYYLGYFVEEETDSLNLINEYYFTIKSQENDYQRQIKIKDSFPYLLGD